MLPAAALGRRRPRYFSAPRQSDRRTKVPRVFPASVHPSPLDRVVYMSWKSPPRTPLFRIHSFSTVSRLTSTPVLPPVRRARRIANFRGPPPVAYFLRNARRGSPKSTLASAAGAGVARARLG